MVACKLQLVTSSHGMKIEHKEIPIVAFNVYGLCVEIAQLSV